jgi:large conductance mechanosensitive channel
MEAAHVHKLEDYTWHGSKPGMFVSSVFTFLITGMVVFILIKVINRFRERDDKKEAEKAPVPNLTEKLLTEIRDELRVKPR